MQTERSYNDRSFYSTQVSILELGKSECKRWYILIIFSILSSLQCNSWFTFSSVPHQVEQYYHLNDPGDDKVNNTIDLLLNYGPIMFLLTIPFAAYVLSYPVKGLRYNVLIAANCVFLGCFIRSIPSVLQDFQMFNYKITNSFWHTLIFLHIGQILISIAGPLILSAPSKLSVIWFPEYERKTATSIAVISYAFGMGFGYIIGPYIVQENSTNIRYLLYFDLFLISLIWLLIMIYFPFSPNRLPSIAAKASLLSIPIDNLNDFIEEMCFKASSQMDTSCSISFWDASERIKTNTDYAIGNDDMLLGKSFFGSGDSNIEHIVNFIPYSKNKLSIKQHLNNLLKEIKYLTSSISIVFIVLIFGMLTSCCVAYQSVLHHLIGSSTSIGLNHKLVSIIATTNNLSYIFGGLVLAIITDKWLAKQLKVCIIICLICIIIVNILLLVMVSSPWNDASLFILHNTNNSVTKTLVIGIINGIGGFFIGCIPLFYELCAEVSYPVSESTSAVFLVFIQNIFLFIFVGNANWISTKWQTIVTLGVCVLSVILLIFVKEKYHRI